MATRTVVQALMASTWWYSSGVPEVDATEGTGGVSGSPGTKMGHESP